MSDCVEYYFFLPDAGAADAFGAACAAALDAGDVLLLDGPVGAGKSHFARAVIRALLGRPEDVPSPSFTLVQVYEAHGTEIWHSDLYRLSHLDELSELGLEDAFSSAICLIEWPERLGPMRPANAIEVSISYQGDGRDMRIRFSDRPALQKALAQYSRDAAAAAFLATHSWGDAQKYPLAGDASSRRYTRLIRAEQRAIFMDNPPGTADDPRAFAAIAQYLRGIGICAPQIFAQDLNAGFLVLEDLGDALFARVLTQSPEREAALYRSAVDVLLHIQKYDPPEGLPCLNMEEWAEAAMLAADFYARTARRPQLKNALHEALERHAKGRPVMIHRDFHAENLIALHQGSGVGSVGVLDFQLAQMGQSEYDLVSLLQDARRDVSPDLESAMLEYFAQMAGCDMAQVKQTYAIWGVQRALRILGIFARLAQMGKPQYLSLLPRVWAQLQRNLGHPELAALKTLCAASIPAPTPALLARLKDNAQ